MRDKRRKQTQLVHCSLYQPTKMAASNPSEVTLTSEKDDKSNGAKSQTTGNIVEVKYENVVVRSQKDPAIEIAIEQHFMNTLEEMGAGAKEYFPMLHSQFRREGVTYITYTRRFGPRLDSILDQYHPLDDATVGRLGMDILRCLRILHSAEHRVTTIQPDSFTFAIDNRHLILSDLSTIRSNRKEKHCNRILEQLESECPDELAEVREKLMETEPLPTERDNLHEWYDLLLKMRLPDVNNVHMEQPKGYSTIQQILEEIPNNAQAIPQEVYGRLEAECRDICKEGGNVHQADLFVFEKPCDKTTEYRK